MEKQRKWTWSSLPWQHSVDMEVAFTTCRN
jgi:hypothetical protein